MGLGSYEVLGGPHPFNTVWANSKFATANPKIMKAFLDALEESMTRIKADPAAAAALWVKAANSKLPVADPGEVIRDAQDESTTRPKKAPTYLAYIHRPGLITNKASGRKPDHFG